MTKLQFKKKLSTEYETIYSVVAILYRGQFNKPEASYQIKMNDLLIDSELSGKPDHTSEE